MPLLTRRWTNPAWPGSFSVKSDKIRCPSQILRVPGNGCRFEGMKPARRAVLTANSAMVWPGPGGPRCLRWTGFAMWMPRT